MKIIFIGSGNVATHMAGALKASGNDIVQVCSRTPGNAALLARRMGALPVDAPGQLSRDADLYIFSVKDDLLPAIAAQMPPTGGVWVHTAGSLPVSCLSPHEKRGVIYPLQTFSRERAVDFREVPLFIEANNDETARLLKSLAETISREVHFLSGEKRRLLHLAAIFASNFVNHMYTLASEIVAGEEIPFRLLHPLIGETAAKVTVMDPQAAQTGPAVRFDEKVMRRHLELLNDPLQREIYSLLSESIGKVSDNGRTIVK